MLTAELAIDIGHSQTVIAQRGKGVIFDEPSLIMVTKQRGKVKLLASGNEARKKLHGRERVVGSTFIRPIIDGNIENSEATILMLSDFLRKALPNRSFLSPKPECLVSIPCGTSAVERQNYENVFIAAGFKRPILMETPLAVIATLNTENNLIVASGATVTDVAIVGAQGIITGCSVNIAGKAMDDAISSYVSDNYKLNITSECAEEIRKNIGSFGPNQAATMDVVGKNIFDGMRHHIELTSDEINPILFQVADKLIEVIENVSMMCPEKIIMDVYKAGITFCGGLAESYGLAQYIAQKIHMAVNVPMNPHLTVCRGTLLHFEDKDRMFKLLG